MSTETIHCCDLCGTETPPKEMRVFQVGSRTAMFGTLVDVCPECHGQPITAILAAIDGKTAVSV